MMMITTATTKATTTKALRFPAPWTDPASAAFPCYRQHLQRIKDRRYYHADERQFVIEVPLSELTAWDAVRGGDLAERAAKNTIRYATLFCNVLDQILLELPASTNSNAGAVRDTVDILHEQRWQQQQENQANQQQQQQQNNNNNAGLGPMEEEEQQNQQNNPPPGAAAFEDLPPILLRRYELRILPPGRRGVLPPFVNQKTDDDDDKDVVVAQSLRQVRAHAVGKLVTISGLLVRCSDVKPACVVATYACDACGAEVYQPVQNQREFLPVTACPSDVCRRHSKKGNTLHLQSRGSKFTKFQECKLQELPHQVPMGHVPRSIRILCRGELTRLASPGDCCTVDGVFLPQRLAESGYQAMKAGLIATTYVEAQNIVTHKKSYDSSSSNNNTEDQELQEQVLRVATGPDPVGRLAGSLAPEIFGHADIKRSLLLQLVGGCTRKLPDGMRIRGDVNICLMGDPGVAKSQLLKHVASIAPRGVYTTGKGSSGVGLTAAVTKDLATGEMALEGGALVLADRGICCIDEFDKMDESDRTAIHEVMEQQTVSIAKAGIVATLNARTSVLAAANPLYGRYNRHKSLSENINLPNSLLSRFDLLFLILDVADADKDMALARHVTLVHQNEGLKKNSDDKDDDEDDEDAMEDDDDNDDNKNKGDDVVPPRVMREYIARARQHHPVMPPEVAPYVVEAYVSLRQQDTGSKGNKSGSDQTVMTARQLLSILRLSQALARLRFSDFVAREDVDEAIRLTHQSKSSLLDDDNDEANGGNKKRGEDVMSRIFHILRDYASVSGKKEVELQLAEAMVLRKGFTTQQLESCLEEYEALQVIQINRTRTHVYFVG